MRKKFITFILVGMICLFQSCHQHDDIFPHEPGTEDEIVLTAEIGPAPTRMSQIADNTYVFDAGDSIRIVGWTGAYAAVPDASNPSEYAKWWINSVNVFNGRKWTATPYMRWQNGEGIEHHFVSWYPAGIAIAPRDDLKSIYHLSTDTYNPDILVASTSLTRPSDNRVNLHFSHLLSRFDLHLKFVDYYQDITNISVTSELTVDATINLIAGNLTQGSVSATVSVDEVAPTEGNTWSGSRIVVPQNTDGCSLTIKFVANGKDYSMHYTHPSLHFEQGKRTTLRLLVSKDDILLQGVGVSAWSEGSSLGDADAEESGK